MVYNTYNQNRRLERFERERRVAFTNINQVNEVADIAWIPINKLNNYYIINDIKLIIKNINTDIKKERMGKKIIMYGK